MTAPTRPLTSPPAGRAAAPGADATGPASSRARKVLDTVDARLRRTLPRPVYEAFIGGYHDLRELARRNPGRGRLLPNFVIIGAAKAATTSLYGWLSQHPFVEPATHK